MKWYKFLNVLLYNKPVWHFEEIKHRKKKLNQIIAMTMLKSSKLAKIYVMLDILLKSKQYVLR